MCYTVYSEQRVHTKYISVRYNTMTDVITRHEDLLHEIDSVGKQIVLYRNKLEKLEEQGKADTFEYDHTVHRIFDFECIRDELVTELRTIAEEYVIACIGK